jgi:hypothetical protein
MPFITYVGHISPTGAIIVNNELEKFEKNKHWHILGYCLSLCLSKQENYLTKRQSTFCSIINPFCLPELEFYFFLDLINFDKFLYVIDN